MTVSKRIVPRSEWGARYGNGNDVSARLPWSEVVIHTEAGALRPEDWAELEGKQAEYAALNASLSERQKVQAVERFHAVTRGWDGIAYSFFVTFDGTVFEGRGWGRSGAHTEGRNSTAAGVCLQGHGDIQKATEAQWAAVAWLIGEGIRLGKLTPRPKASGHRDYSQKGKTCPGNLIYPQIPNRLANIAGPTTPEPPKGPLMALSDKEQTELLEKVREIHGDSGSIRGFIEAVLEAAEKVNALFFGTGARRLRDRAGHLNPYRKK